ncbi:serine/threonine-protein kinase Nek1-like isoform X2 [Haliotis rufescens]|uniref:serine/threonine-protein kinase Nek1-like isoform X2 n=1 Tax=Haliotis rufescens TaxID=6454 RepID=UPI00201F1CCB|nr:serine/threonine-protein kinase Nek1-like isoform X2 [Haliotis rufescens]
MDNYTRVRKIGEGAFGKALLVKSKATGGQFVIKEISIGRMNQKERVESRKEVAVLAQLKHPNIVAYRESFEEKGCLFIVMDFCSGGDLYGRINSQRGMLFTEDQIMNWFVQTCLAIKHIHDRKILHRDIKSQNIFLTSDGRIQIGDFGIAKVLNSTVELARTCIGTPYYLSPEIVENKPYNNKSDIWSLGCVLYELTTLKHAFEAGNMKNLVLKIIRGSYPPIPPKYTYELRGLIAQLFKRAPRDRPSINSILKKNFIIPRVRNLLTEEKMAEEFSHTLLHGQKIARALPPPPRPASAGPKRAAPSPRPGSAAGRYNPAAVYGAPLARKSKEVRPDLKKRNASGGKIIPGQQDWERRKQDLVQKENKRREDMKKREQEMYARQHKDLVERQKMARMNKAREEGWKGLIDSVGSDDNNPPPANPNPVPRPLPRPAVVGPEENKVPLKERGNYDQYSDYLNRIKGERNARGHEAPPVPAPRQNPGNYMAAPRPGQQYGQNKADRDYINRALQRGPNVVNNHVKQAEENRRAAAQASERARLAEDFINRKRAAALNKQRGHAQMYGYTPPATPISRPGSAKGGKPGGGAANARNREEQEYLEKLRQIREQNMRERRKMQGKEEQKQADEWSQKKKEELDKEKQQIMKRMKEREEYMKQREEQRARENRPSTPKVNLKPVAAVPITGALHAIGAVEEAKSPDRPKSAKQQKKDEILKRLNDKGQGRSQWDNPSTPDLAIQEEDDGSGTARSKWGEADKGDLAHLPLEQTASQMEATSAGDQVVKSGVTSPPPVTPRNQWGKPSDTLVGALQKMPICDATMTINSNRSGGSTSSQGSESPAPPSPSPVVPPISSGVGATITISKTPIQKGTITIKAADDAAVAKAAKDAEADTAEKTSTQPSEESDIIGQEEKPSTNEIAEVIDEKEEESTSQSEDVKQADIKPSVSDDKVKVTDVESLEVEEVEEEMEEVKEKVEGLQDVTVEEKSGIAHKAADVFPKPRLLPKPDLPEELFVTGPDVVRSQGAGSLFDKVELEEEEEEEEKKQVLVKSMDGSGDGNKLVTKGITTGQFDLRDIGLMRTASEPDLSKLGKSECESPAKPMLTRHMSMDLSVVEEEAGTEEETTPETSPRNDQSKSPLSPVSQSEETEKSGEAVASDEEADGNSKKTEDSVEEEDDDDYDDDDLMSVRATMQSLLIDDDSGGSNKIPFSLSTEDAGEQPDGEDSQGGDENGEGAEGEQEEVEEENKYEDDNDDDNDEELKRLIDGDDDDDRISTSDLFDDSDGETQFGDDDDDDDDLFSRLEQQRAELEAALGDKLIEVYKAVQALQEDEDGNMEEGARMAMDMLGKEQEHLYPKIFQLVLSDTAYTEDNA